MKRKTLTPEQKFAREVCDAYPGGAGCCMPEADKEPCNEQNCLVFKAAISALSKYRAAARDRRKAK